MTYAGARVTRQRRWRKHCISRCLRNSFTRRWGVTSHDLNAAHDGYQLKVANALWGQQGYTFLDDFLKLTKDNYGAGFNTVDFKGATEEARQTINSWVEQQTENKIKDLIAPGVLKPETRLVLTNAIYFKGDWQTPFDKTRTGDEYFSVILTQPQSVTAAIHPILVPMMHRMDDFNYLAGDGFQALEIPYKGKDLSMVLFLPHAADGLPAFEASLTAANMQQWLSQLRPASSVHLTLPKFKLAAEVGLRETLMAMGMREAFDPRLADFSGIASRQLMQGEGNLYVSAVIHKAYADANEEGTEAAAATAALVFEPTSAVVSLSQPPILIFCANHPFLFLIRDNRSGGILFMGRVTDPSK